MDPDSSSIYPALAAFAILLVLSGLFSTTEAAFTGINDSQTKRRAAEGDKRAQQIMGLIRKPTVFISTVRTGSTLCNMLGLAVLSPSLTDLFLRQVYPEMESPALVAVRRGISPVSSVSGSSRGCSGTSQFSTGAGSPSYGS